MMPIPAHQQIAMAAAGPQIVAGGVSAPLALDASKKFANYHGRLSGPAARHAP